MQLLDKHPNVVGKSAQDVKPGDVVLLSDVVKEVTLTDGHVTLRFEIAPDWVGDIYEPNATVVTNEDASDDEDDEDEFKVGDIVKTVDDGDEEEEGLPLALKVEAIHNKTSIYCSWDSGRSAGTWHASDLSRVCQPK